MPKLLRSALVIVAIITLLLSVFPSQANASVLSDIDAFRLLNTSILASMIPKNLFPGKAQVQSLSVETGLLLGGFEKETLKTSLADLPGLESSANDIDKYPLLPQMPCLYFQLAFPWGVSVDTQFLPPISSSSVKIRYWTTGLKWNYLAALMPSSKLDASIRITRHSFSIGKSPDYDVASIGYGLLHTIGKRWNWASLWVGYGFATSSLDLSLNTSKFSITEAPRSTGLHVSIGGVLEGGGFVSGLEWANIIGVNTFTLKLGFQI
jgi:hypothetical protein